MEHRGFVALDGMHPPGHPMATVILRTGKENALYLYTLICAFSNVFFEVETIVIAVYEHR